MLSSSDVHNFLLGLGVAHEILHLPARSSTVARAAAQLGVAPSEVVKSLVFMVDGEPHLVLVPGHLSVDAALLAERLGAERVALVKGADVLEITGYRVGAVPPCGLARGLPAVADPDAFTPTVVYCGGGDTTTMLKIRAADLQAVVQPLVAEVAKRAG
jgi:prolyl-tRNA editing enzyme YbaK/EbsC (Cys-tRNA(Pro) deacylase)